MQNCRINGAKFLSCLMMLGIAVVPVDLQPALADEALSACTHLLNADGEALTQISSKSIQQPAVNAEVEVEVGQTILSTLSASIYPATVTLAEDLTYSGEDATAGFGVTIPAGTFQVYSNAPGINLYSARAAQVTFKGEVVKAVAVGVALRSDPTKPPRIWWTQIDSFWMGGQAHTYAADVPTAHVTATNCIGPSKDNFKRELVYSGVSKRTISLLYREFTNDLARPAFSQELHYDLSDGDEIGYQGARFKIIKASNTSIRYEVLRPLD